MDLHKCSHCKINRPSNEFYKNSKKKNGLESRCRQCVLAVKSIKYRKVKNTQLKNKQLRLHKKVNVIDVNNCTFLSTFINSSNEQQNKILTSIAEELIWQQRTNQY